MKILSQITPGLPCDYVFEKEEWEAIYLITQQTTPPKTAPPLHEMLNMLASLGGHLGRKHDGPLGAKVLWIGLQRVRDFMLGLRNEIGAIVVFVVMYRGRSEKMCSF